MTDAQKGLVAWLLVLVPVWTVMVLCTHWEPISHDGWGFWGWHEKFDVSFESLATYAKNGYVYNNPRIGQVLTLALYTEGPWHSIVTPIVELALFYLLT